MKNLLRFHLLASIGVVASIAASCGGGAVSSGFAAGDSDGGSDAGGDASTSGGGLFSDANNNTTPPPPSDACPPCSTENVNLASSSCDLECSATSAPPASCDQGLAYAGPATDFAKAIGICQTADATHWGLVSASYTRGYNSTTAPADGQHGILGSFGTVIKPREGANLGVLSSGYARPCDDASATATCSSNGSGDPYFKGGVFMYDGAGAPPPGYPKSTSCPLASDIHDTIGVTLKIKTPANAQGFSFDFDFWSGEWPDFVCTRFNDAFVAWLESSAWAGKAGDLNISWDSKGNPVSVNNGFFSQCTPNTPTCNGGVAACPGGIADLLGTGFFNVGSYCGGATSTGGGATGWLTTKAPVKGGETITLQFIIWDTGDQAYDSTVLVDHLTWYGTTTTTGTTPAPPAQ
jgi:hypothetical protein